MSTSGPFYLSPIFIIPLIALIVLPIVYALTKSRTRKLVRLSKIIAVICLLLVVPQIIYGAYNDMESRAHAVDIKREYNSENEKKAIEIAEKFRYEQVFQNVSDLGYLSCYINESFLKDRTEQTKYYRNHPFSEKVSLDYRADTVTVNGTMELIMYSNKTIGSRFYAKEPAGHLLFDYVSDFFYAVLNNGTYEVYQFPKNIVSNGKLTIDDAIIVDMTSSFFQGSLGESRHQTVVLDRDLRVQLIILPEKGNIA